MPEDSSRLITRRRSLELLASAGGLFIAGSGSGGAAVAGAADGDDYVAGAAAACSLTPEQEEGPYYVALDKVREDIIGSQKGIPMKLEITIVNAKTCKPLKHAAVDIWHCNAAGRYSDKRAQGTLGQTWLRGVQFTDKHGLATFRTIYPGHYPVRTTHLHIKVHAGSASQKGKLTGGHVAHTGDLFPPEAVNTAVYKLSPYKADTAAIVPQTRDSVFTRQHGSAAMMKVSKVGNRLAKGLVGRVTLAVDPNATPALIGIRH